MSTGLQTKKSTYQNVYRPKYLLRKSLHAKMSTKQKAYTQKYLETEMSTHKNVYTPEGLKTRNGLLT